MANEKFAQSGADKVNLESSSRFLPLSQRQRAAENWRENFANKLASFRDARGARERKSRRPWTRTRCHLDVKYGLFRPFAFGK